MRQIKPLAPRIIVTDEDEQSEGENKVPDSNEASGVGKIMPNKGRKVKKAGQAQPAPILHLPPTDQRIVITISGMVGKPGPDDDPEKLPPIRRPRPVRGLKPVILTHALEPDKSETGAKTRAKDPSKLTWPIQNNR